MTNERVSLERNEKCRDILRFLIARCPGSNDFYTGCLRVVDAGYLLTVKQADAIEKCYRDHRDRKRKGVHAVDTRRQ